MMTFEPIDGVRVVVDEVTYMPALQTPPDKPHPFIYYLSIYNDSDESIRILGRKWVVEEIGLETIVVEGDGVVGQKPVIHPGEKFSYNSYHVVARNAVVDGAFYGLTFTGAKMIVEVPTFNLQTP